MNNNMTQQFLDTMLVWLRKKIPEETKNCLRTTLGTIVGTDDNETVTVRLIGSPSDGSEDLKKIKVDGACSKNDVVIIAYTNNNLTNAFVLFNLNSSLQSGQGGEIVDTDNIPTMTDIEMDNLLGW